MNLPIPTDAEVEEFRDIYERQFGVRPEVEEARDGATRLLQLFYLCTYGSLQIDREKWRQSGPHGDGVSGAKE